VTIAQANLGTPPSMQRGPGKPCRTCGPVAYKGRKGSQWIHDAIDQGGGMAFRWSKRLGVLVLVLVALTAFASLAVRSIREPVLRVAGWALVTSEPVAAADVIVLAKNI